MKKLYTALLCPLLLCLASIFPQSGQGQVLAWNLNTKTGSEVSDAATTQDANLSSSLLTRGAGVTASGLANAFSSSGWDAPTKAAAIAGNKYYQFTVTAAAGFQVSLSTLDVYFRRSATGPQGFQWQYSLNGFSNPVDTVDVGDTIAYKVTTTNGDQQTQLVLSGIPGLQNVASGTTITFRLYGWLASASGGTFALGRPAGANSLAIGGTVTAAGGGSTPAITVGGAGSLTAFSTITGTASAAQSITVSGANLTNDITLTPNAPYEISTDGGSSYSSLPLTLTQSGGSVSNTTVNIRIAAGAPTGTANANLVITSTGAATQTIALTGNVNSNVAPPQTFTATGVSMSEIDLTATGNAAGDNIVVAFNTSSSFGTPSGALTSGSVLSGGGTVLYSGPSAAFAYQHTGLNPSAIYFYKAWSVDGSLVYSSNGLTAGDTTLNPPAANIVINQVYGGGGNSGATYKNDFIELYNNESNPVNLLGWSVQYNSATGTGTWQKTNLSGTIPAHAFFLIQEAAGASTTAINLPAPDVIAGSAGNPSTISMGAVTAKVILSNSSFAQSGGNPTGPTVIDKVGWGSATGFEGHVADSTSNTTALRRITDGVTTHDNDADFITDAPIPRNSTYTTAPPLVAAFNPPPGSDSLPYNYALSFTFDKKVVKGSGSITLSDGTTSTPIDVNSSDVAISGNTTVLLKNAVLASGKSYSIQISAGAFQDVYGNPFAGILNNSTWTFKTFDGSAAVALPANFNFSSCTGTGLLPDGFTQFSVTGDQVWDCTTFGRKPGDPSFDSAFEHAVQINGYSNGDHLNEDWLISPKFDLSATTYPILSYWSRSAFAGDPLQLKISTDYSGTGDPSLATWTDLNGKFPSVGSDVWTLSNNINLAAFRQGSVYLAWVYKSTTEDGSRYSLDDISLINSLSPPPPSLTVSTTNILLGYAAAGSTVTKKMIVTGNDLTGDITLSTGGGFLISPDSVTFGTTLTIGHDTANNIPEPVYVRFAPPTTNMLFDDSVAVSISDTTVNVSLKGNSIDPSSTLSIVNWNLNWFGTPEVGFGPTDKNLQRQNVRIILPSMKADIYALQEVVDSAGLDAIVATMPGYTYVLNNYGSHSNTAESGHFALNTIQKLAFVYNTAKVANIHTDSLFSFGVNTSADLTTPYYNAFASGRFPYMLTADVTLSDNNGGTIVKQLRLINIHGKANSGSNPADLLTSYNRRKDGAHYLDSLIKNIYGSDNVILLGDYNDDLDSTITNGIHPRYSSYKEFTDDSALYIFPTKILSQQGFHSDVNFTGSIIDNVIISKPLAPYYLPNSATILTEVSELVNKYGTTTTDHYPVFTQMSFSPPVPLPVKLLDFTGARQGQTVKLSWTTTEESNSKEFDIERSPDGAHFLPIGTVAAKGYSQTATAYQFIDQDPLAGANFYRLRQVDLDARSEYSKTVRVQFAKALSLRINPNPTHATLYLTVDNATDVRSIQILDLSGRVVKSIIPTGAIQGLPVNVAGLARGVYTVKVVSKDALTTTKLLIQ